MGVGLSTSAGGESLAGMATKQGDDALELDLELVRARLRTLGARASKSAEEARARQIAETNAMTPWERMLLSLRLGLRDRSVGGRER